MYRNEIVMKLEDLTDGECEKLKQLILLIMDNLYNPKSIHTYSSMVKH